MFEQFPYTDLHDLNLDWIIKVVKDFLDKYTHIQELIDAGVATIDQKTADSLDALATKATELEGLLNAWYETHSADIANELQEAITSLSTEALQAQERLEQAADTKLANTLASIPSDYTDLSNSVNNMYTTLLSYTLPYTDTSFWEKGGLAKNGVNDTYRIESRIRNTTFIKFDRGITITSIVGSNAQVGGWIKNADGSYTQIPWGQNRTIEPGTTARLNLDDQYNQTSLTSHTIEQVLSSFRITAVIAPMEEMVQSYPSTLTNSQLTLMNVTHIDQLPKNRIYFLNNLTIDGLPDGVTSPVNGALLCLKSDVNGWPMFILTINNGRTYFGTATGGTMRWESGKNMQQYPYLLNDSRVSTMGITKISDLPGNMIYSVNNCSAFTDFPVNAEIPFNGALVTFRNVTNGWRMFILTDNAGRSWTGICTDSNGATIRWGSEHLSLTEQISGIYGKNVVLVGDSIMYGSHMPDVQYGDRTVITIRGTTVKENLSPTVWTHGFMEYLEDTYNCNVLNQSFPGCSYNDLTSNMSTLMPANYDYALIMLGVNDQSAPATIKTHIKTVALYCKQNNIVPIFITPYPTREYLAQMAQIRTGIMSYTNEVADFYSIFSEYLDLKAVSLSAIMDDTVHYNVAGQPYILNCVKWALKL